MRTAAVGRIWRRNHSSCPAVAGIGWTARKSASVPIYSSAASGNRVLPCTFSAFLGRGRAQDFTLLYFRAERSRFMDIEEALLQPLSWALGQAIDRGWLEVPKSTLEQRVLGFQLGRNIGQAIYVVLVDTPKLVIIDGSMAVLTNRMPVIFTVYLASQY